MGQVLTIRRANENQVKLASRFIEATQGTLYVSSHDVRLIVQLQGAQILFDNPYTPGVLLNKSTRSSTTAERFDPHTATSREQVKKLA